MGLLSISFNFGKSPKLLESFGTRSFNWALNFSQGVFDFDQSQKPPFDFYSSSEDEDFSLSLFGLFL